MCFCNKNKKNWKSDILFDCMKKKPQTYIFVSQIRIADWMRGKTCGLCGKADGEVRQEFRTPSGRLTKNAVSYAHSWVLPSESCRDTSGETTHLLWNPGSLDGFVRLMISWTPLSECHLKLESVQLEKQVNIHGHESKCYSVEPVLRCLPGCLPVKTTAVTVGFHCLPAGESVTFCRAPLQNFSTLYMKHCNSWCFPLTFKCVVISQLWAALPSIWESLI